MLSISPRLPIVLAVVAGIGMVFITAWQAYGFTQSQSSSSAAAAGHSAAQNSQPEQQTPDLSLASVSMFGDASQADLAAQESIDNLPETNLKLFLRGVMSASGNFSGSALVEDSKNHTEAYLAGDELPGNATLRTVRPDRIIIERSGALENLYFPANEDRGGISLVNGNSGSSDVSADPDQGRDQQQEELKQRLEQLRNRLINNN